MILIDNYDSFTFNIIHYVKELGVEPVVFQNDEISFEELKRMDFDSIILAPGAGNPDGAGCSLDIIKEFYDSKKILGICLGHQCIAQFFGSKIVRAVEPVHGKVSRIKHSNSVLFRNIPEEFNVVRYHSLAVENIAADLRVTARTSDGVIMAFEHKIYPVFGVQFHPEAILSEYGHQLFKNFISI